jgi:hypothetical protein
MGSPAAISNAYLERPRLDLVLKGNGEAGRGLCLGSYWNKGLG